MSAVVYAQQGDTVDLICFRYFWRTDKVTEQTLELNPGLAAFGANLPQGTAILLPAAPPPPTRERLNLWN